MRKSLPDEVKIMGTLRALDPVKREIVLNLANAEFRGAQAPTKRTTPRVARGAKAAPPVEQ